jgi:AcrR family transcriptional regulator
VEQLLAMTRKYVMRQRAEAVEATRRRIVEAAICLHATVGPARTTVSAIAEQAAVERQTYYRHFPDDRALMQACSGLYMQRNPLPDAEAWRAVADPQQRLRHGLAEMYRYYEANEPLLANVLRDAEVHPLTREIVSTALQAIAALREVLVEGLGGGDQVRAAVELALGFHTWRSLVRHSRLSRDAAVELMATLVNAA